MLYKDATYLGYCRHFQVEGNWSFLKRSLDSGSLQTPSKQAQANRTLDVFLSSMEKVEVKQTST